MLRRLPQPVLDDLSRAELIIFKGDVNTARGRALAWVDGADPGSTSQAR